MGGRWLGVDHGHGTAGNDEHADCAGNDEHEHGVHFEVDAEIPGRADAVTLVIPYREIAKVELWAYDYSNTTTSDTGASRSSISSAARVVTVASSIFRPSDS